MFRYLPLIVVLIIADDVGQKMEDLLVLLDHFLNERHEDVINILQKLLIKTLINRNHVLVKLLGRVHVQFDVHVFLVYFHQFVQTVQQSFLFQERQVRRLEDLAFR